jgi:hypothetical protein
MADGTDHLAGGERAAHFCTHLSALLPAPARLGGGAAPRWARFGEDMDTVIDPAATCHVWQPAP